VSVARILCTLSADLYRGVRQMRRVVAFALLLPIISWGAPVTATEATKATEGLDSGQDFTLDIHKPEGEGPFPAVLLLHGCGGLSPGVTQGLSDHADVLVAAGFVAVVMGSFSRRDKAGGRVCKSQEELGYARHYRTKDAYQAQSLLASLPFVDRRNFFLIGQSNGGSVALLLASGYSLAGRDDVVPFRGVVAFYPWCGALMATPELVSPLLVLGAGQDDWVSPEGCRQRAVRARGAAMEVVIYEEAHHSFDLPITRQVYAGHIVEGDPEATIDSRRRILDFFQQQLTH
jgi:dienelactone hydrolase